MNTPLVSIIIPTYNRAHLIGETLDSVLAQTYTNWECIVVDDGSTDGTAELLATYCKNDERFQYHHRPTDRPKGANACRNYGLKLSKGKYLIFFDSDDIMKKSCLNNRVSAIENSIYDMVVFSMGRFQDVNELKIDINRIVFNGEIEETILEFLKGKLPWNICRPIHKAAFIKSNNIFFNEQLLKLQDIEFNIQILYKLKPNYISIDETDCYYRFSELIGEKYYTKGFSNQLFISLEEYYKSIFKIFGNYFLLKNRQIFINQFYGFIKAYARNYTSFNNVKFIILNFKYELNLKHREMLGLYGVFFINKYLFGKRGSYKLTKYCNQLIEK